MRPSSEQVPGPSAMPEQACDAATWLGPESIFGTAGTLPLRLHDFRSQPRPLPTVAAAAALDLTATHLTVHQTKTHTN